MWDYSCLQRKIMIESGLCRGICDYVSEWYAIIVFYVSPATAITVVTAHISFSFFRLHCCSLAFFFFLGRFLFSFFFFIIIVLVVYCLLAIRIVFRLCVSLLSHKCTLHAHRHMQARTEHILFALYWLICNFTFFLRFVSFLFMLPTKNNIDRIASRTFHIDSTNERVQARQENHMCDEIERDFNDFTPRARSRKKCVK